MPTITPEDLTEIIVALTGLITAAAALVAAFRNVHSRIDANSDRLDVLTNLYQSSSPKVLPPPKH